MTINDCFTRIMSQLYLCIIKHPPSLLKTIAPVHFKLTTTTHRITTPAVSLCASMPCALASVPCHEGVANRFPARSAFPRKAEAETHAYNLIPTQNTLARPTTPHGVNLQYNQQSLRTTNLTTLSTQLLMGLNGTLKPFHGEAENSGAYRIYIHYKCIPTSTLPNPSPNSFGLM